MKGRMNMKRERRGGNLRGREERLRLSTLLSSTWRSICTCNEEFVIPGTWVRSAMSDLTLLSFVMMLGGYAQLQYCRFAADLD